MIDIDKAKKIFREYVSNYNIDNKKIRVKFLHTLRVVDLCKNIAMSLNMSDEEQSLAELLGLLHDIGRFEQCRLYDSFDDLKTVDHGHLGVSILKENNFIRNFIEEDIYDDLIYKVVECHNKKDIPDSYNDKEKLYSKIIRDADKIDILYIATTSDRFSNIKEEVINDKVLDSIINKKNVDRIHVNNELDSVILEMSFIYDLNFQYSIDLLREKNYIGMIVDIIDLHDKKAIEKMNKIVDSINNNFNLIKE